MQPVLMLIFSLILLIIGSNLTIDGLKKLAIHFKFSSFFVGLTLAAFATSLPEISTSIFSAIKGADGVAIGNIIGSNISNITLILGIFALFTPLMMNKKMFKTDSSFLAIGVLVLIMALIDGHINPVEGILMVVIYFVYILHLLTENHITKEKLIIDAKKNKKSLFPVYVFLIIGVGLIVFSSNILVDSVVETARLIGVSEYIISVFIIGVGTSMPELIFSITSFFRKSTAIGIGNLIGSNVTNPLLALGVGSLFGGYTISKSLISFDLIFLSIVTVFFVIVTYVFKKIDRKKAIVFLGIYVAYVFIKLQQGISL